MKKKVSISGIVLLALIIVLSVVGINSFSKASAEEGASTNIDYTGGMLDGLYGNVTDNDESTFVTIPAGQLKEFKFTEADLKNIEGYRIKASGSLNFYVTYKNSAGNWVSTSAFTKAKDIDGALVPFFQNDVFVVRVENKGTTPVDLYEINVYGPSIEPTPTPTPTPEQPTGNRAILSIELINGTQKEFDLSVLEVASFLSWYEAKASGSGTTSFAIDKHENNKGPFKARKDYVIFDKILTFEVNEY